MTMRDTLVRYVLFCTTIIVLHACSSEDHSPQDNSTGAAGGGGIEVSGESSSSSTGNGSTTDGGIGNEAGVTTHRTCRRTCATDDDCCPIKSPEGTCGVENSYPYNIFCDMNGLCRDAQCSPAGTDCPQMGGYECVPVNALWQCQRTCSGQVNSCPVGQTCSGVDDNGIGYCKEKPFCDPLKCNGVCVSDICVCAHDDQCVSSERCVN